MSDDHIEWIVKRVKNSFNEKRLVELDILKALSTQLWNQEVIETNLISLIKVYLKQTCIPGKTKKIS